jgi:hypothetical protein
MLRVAASPEERSSKTHLGAIRINPQTLIITNERKAMPLSHRVL